MSNHSNNSQQDLFSQPCNCDNFFELREALVRALTELLCFFQKENHCDGAYLYNQDKIIHFQSEKIIEWLNSISYDEKTKLTSSEILSSALNIPPNQITRSHQTKLGLLLSKINWGKKKKLRENGQLRWVYLRDKTHKTESMDS